MAFAGSAGAQMTRGASKAGQPPRAGDAVKQWRQQHAAGEGEGGVPRRRGPDLHYPSEERILAEEQYNLF
jgi:hypothetical protein